jgi:hypothetical protein
MERKMNMIGLKGMPIDKKLVVSILFISIIGIAFLDVFIYIRSSSLQKAAALENAQNLAGKYAKDVQAQLEVPMDAARTLAQVMELFESIEPDRRRDYYDLMIKGILEANPEFVGVWSCWEPNALDGLDARYVNAPGSDSTGRFIPYWNRGSGTIEVEALVDYEKSGVGDYYQIPLKSGRESIIDPYSYQIGGQNMLRAAEAAKNTSELIEGTVKKVKDGSGLVETTNEAFQQVAVSAAKVAELVGEIAAASGEQAQGIEEVNKAVTEMDKVTQQNAANAEESASASEELNAQARQMQAMVKDLMRLVGGAKAGMQTRKSAAKVIHHRQPSKGNSKPKTKAVVAPKRS